MPAFSGGSKDPLKEYWWVVVIACVLVGLWIYGSTTGGRMGEDGVIIDRSGEGDEQSLDSLDPSENPQGARGKSLAMPGAVLGGAGAPEVMGSRLYQSPGGAAGAPITEADAKALAQREASGKGEKSSELAQAMARVASGVKAPDHGWGGRKARSGFSASKGKLKKRGSLGTGGGGSSSARMVVKKFFGKGGDPGLNLDPSSFGGSNRPGKGDLNDRGMGKTMEGLKETRRASLASLSGNDELARGLSGKAFDRSSTAKTSLEQLAGDSASAAGLAGGAAVPSNLKATDPTSHDYKKIEVPEVGNEGETDSDNAEYMQKKIMMMVLGMALTGLLGPTFGAMGPMIAQMAMSLDQPQSSDWGDRVNTNSS